MKKIGGYKKSDRYKDINGSQADDVLRGVIQRFESLETKNPRWSTTRLLKEAIKNEPEYLTPLIIGRTVSWLIVKRTPETLAEFKRKAKEMLCFTKKVQVSLRPMYKTNYFEKEEETDL